MNLNNNAEKTKFIMPKNETLNQQQLLDKLLKESKSLERKRKLLNLKS